MEREEKLLVKKQTRDEMSQLLKEISIDFQKKKETEIQKLKDDLKELKKAKKYWLVWEEKEEIFEEETIWKLPILEEVKERNIRKDLEENNILIEWDNYHTLSVLNYTNAWKIDVIYIDPPYNTWNNDFVYNDKIVDKEDKYRHSKWLSFMNKRLKLAKDLLSNNWVIFISIDDNEIAQLKLLCDEIFWEENFISVLSIENNPKWRKNWKFVSITNEYCLIYSKNINIAKFKKTIPKDSSDMIEDENWDYIRNSWKRVLVWENFLNPRIKDNKSDKHYSVYINKEKNTIKFIKEYKVNQVDKNLISIGYKRYISYREDYFVENTYSIKKLFDLFNKWKLNIKDNKIYEKYFSWMIQIKSILTNKKYEAIVNNKKKLYNIDLKTTSAKQQLNILMWKELFTFPKNISFIKELIKLNSKTNSTILDFFAWSWTTWHAVLELNKEDWWNRKFILATNNENNICEEVTYERLKRVMTWYKNQKWEQVEWLWWNLTYLKTDFIDKHKSNDDLRQRMVNRCTELLCLKKNIWKEIKRQNDKIKLFQRNDKYLAILYDMFYLDEFKKVLWNLDKEVSIYAFSHYKLLKQDFENIKVPFEIEDIPDPILEVYNKIFGL